MVGVALRQTAWRIKKIVWWKVRQDLWRTVDNFVVGVAQLVEHLIVVQDVAGSSPVTHPSFITFYKVVRFLSRASCPIQFYIQYLYDMLYSSYV